MCDAGNSSVKLALASPEKLGRIYALPGKRGLTADLLALLIRQILSLENVEAGQLLACLVCSVVPGMRESLRCAFRDSLFCNILFVPEDLEIPLLNSYRNPEEAGADRLAAAYGARRMFPQARGLVLADFGSIATFDSVMDNEWQGGLLFPGPDAAMEAMNRAAPALPRIEAAFEGIDFLKGRTTREAMRGGVLHGYAALAEGLCGRLAKELPAPVKIVATGGFAGALKPFVPCFDEVVPNLGLEGLRALYYDKR